MKTLLNLIGVVGLAAMLSVGCKKSESPAPDTGTTSPAPEPVPLEQKVTETAETAKQVISETSAKAQELLTQAQKLVGEKKYEEAGALLQKLADFELTPEQEKLLQDLKATIQKAMESEAVKQGTKAIGNMLGGEK
jgi:outer membrane PBP1 activator LpoA protein